MKLRGVDHIEIYVEDVVKAVGFYKKLGLTVDGTLDEGRDVFLTNGDEERPVRIQLVEAKPGQRLGIDHVAFLVDDVEDSAQELEEQGIQFPEPPIYRSRSGRWTVNFRDPDGAGFQLARKMGRGEYEDFR